jgi:hypothetical protein
MFRPSRRNALPNHPRQQSLATQNRHAKIHRPTTSAPDSGMNKTRVSLASDSFNRQCQFRILIFAIWFSFVIRHSSFDISNARV